MLANLLLILGAVFIVTSVAVLLDTFTEDPPDWLVDLWNAVAHPFRLPRYARGCSVTRTSGLISVTCCDLGRHPRADVEHVRRIGELVDERWRYCNRCKHTYQEDPRG